MKNIVSKQISQKQKVINNKKKCIQQFFKLNSPIDNIIKQFFLPRKRDYQQNILQIYLKIYKILHFQYLVPNGSQQKLYTSLFVKSSLKNKYPKKCIIYLHGYGSTRLQAIQILQVLNQQYALCCFDFSGSGKSQGQIITFGAKQKDDIYHIIEFLKQYGFQKFALWGRSMGATSAILYNLKYQNDDVFVQILDSPFYSFQMVSKELASRLMYIPEFGLDIALSMMKNNCQLLKQINPFNVCLNNLNNFSISTIFVYNEHDQVISYKNTQKICDNFQKAYYEKFLISTMHNQPRTGQVLNQIMKKIQYHFHRTKKEKQKHKNNSQKAKGLQRISKMDDQQIYIKQSILTSRQNNHFYNQITSRQIKNITPFLKSQKSSLMIKTNQQTKEYSIAKSDRSLFNKLKIFSISKQKYSKKQIETSQRQSIKSKFINNYISVENSPKNSKNKKLNVSLKKYQISKFKNHQSQITLGNSISNKKIKQKDYIQQKKFFKLNNQYYCNQ